MSSRDTKLHTVVPSSIVWTYLYHRQFSGSYRDTKLRTVPPSLVLLSQEMPNFVQWLTLQYMYEHNSVRQALGSVPLLSVIRFCL